MGLIGKPSAGKSTFFNAVTRAVLDRAGRLAAEVAPHPFTTIEPNIGPGWYRGGAAHGTGGHHRLLPVVCKDVAGLVPGAYKGRGKGNKFLGDLCDADVLVHVVDISGKSDKDGNIVLDNQGSTPFEDARWIKQELHRWVYYNVRAKWPSIVRKVGCNI